MVDGGSPPADRKHRLDPGLREAFFRTPEPIIPVAPNRTTLSTGRQRGSADAVDVGHVEVMDPSSPAVHELPQLRQRLRPAGAGEPSL